MKQLLFLVLIFFIFQDGVANPTKERKCNNAIAWQKKNLPFIHSESHNLYSPWFTVLAIACGPVIMLDAALKPNRFDFDDVRSISFDDRIQQGQLLEWKRKQIHIKSLDRSLSHKGR